MGCSSSKRIEAAAIDVYRPPPSSFAYFNINAIEEPWLKSMEEHQEIDEKPTHVPAPILEKLNAIEEAPKTWDEVSKALEDLKPSLTQIKPPPSTNPPKPKAEQPPPPPKPTPRKSVSFHTLEELDGKTKVPSKPNNYLKKSESMTKLDPIKKDEPVPVQRSVTTSDGGYKPVKENIFILRDKLEREKEGKPATIVKFDPLSDYPEKCPPGGSDSVVIYTTSLGGVRRTFEDCNKIRSILESHRVVFDERDVSLHGEFLSELKEVLEDVGGGSVPRMFVKGRYIGGVEEVVNLNETGKLGRILNRARIEKGIGRLGCEGCGGARFVPCLECGGSCKIVLGDSKERERCPKCNENGLVVCPLCA
ncbi:hypothetical protein M9H77_32502 [Catharanthus roseus]|uniref:Uncharacterized protein n=1 Tax=Catharanthus roseus TaxID=4058 RepID=A0ACC0A347_CATRO|nr:hypothetical protein M9H77_32502 [Catharanthus roseus]